MNMGSIGASKGAAVGQTQTDNLDNLTGEITFEQMMKLATQKADVHIVGDRTFTVMPKNRQPITGKKKDLSNLIGNAKVAVIDFYNDKSGANDLKRMKDLGFDIIAKYTPGNPSGSSIPARHYYYMRRK